MTVRKIQEKEWPGPLLTELTESNQDVAVSKRLTDAGFSSRNLPAVLWDDHLEGKNRVYLYKEGDSQAEAVIFLYRKDLGIKSGSLQSCRLEADVFETGPASQKVKEELLWQALDQELHTQGLSMTSGYVVIHEAARVPETRELTDRE